MLSRHPKSQEEKKKLTYQLFRLDQVLQALREPPSWSLVSELTEVRTAEHLRQPEFSQPLVTALQLCILAVLESWRVKPCSVVGHSSGEIAAAYAAGLLDRAGAITAAFYRGRAALNRKNEVESDVGMLAVGLGAEATTVFLEEHVGQAWIACFNSPSSVTVSGKRSTLEALREKIATGGHFARLLQVDLAYHSELMGVIGDEYENLLNLDNKFDPVDRGSAGQVTMFSSVMGSKKTTPANALYWKTNMVSPVRFDEALKAMLEDSNAPRFLIEIGPSGALAGPVSQVLKSLPAVGGDVSYAASWSRGAEAGKALFDVAGRLFVAGAHIDMTAVNEYDDNVRAITDLPNYSWNHTVKYWHENAASKDWRFRKYVVHDLLGSKILGTSWHSPTWRNRLSAANVPWLLDHKMGGDAIMPGAGFVTLAVEALYQKHCALLNPDDDVIPAPNDMCYRIRNVRFQRALVVEDDKHVIMTLTLTKVPGSKDWHEFRISSSEADVHSEHCSGWVRIQDPIDERVEGSDAAPLRSPQASKLWYKAQREIGMDFGPAFQRLIKIEATSGQRACRTLFSLSPPESKWSPQSYYPIHPAALDGCLQTPIPANAEGERSNVKAVMIPSIIDDFIINKVPAHLGEGLSVAKSVYSGRGRPDQDRSWIANTSVYDPVTGALIMRVTGLNYIKLDVAPKADPHTFHSVSWKPDITFMTPDQMIYLSSDKESTKLDTVVDLIAYKKPALKVLEINLDDADTSCIWFEAGDLSARAAYSQYSFASANAKSLVSVQSRHEDKGSTSFLSITPDKEALGLPIEISYDLAIIKTLEKINRGSMEDKIKHLRPLLSVDAFTLFVQPKAEETTTDGDNPRESEDTLENLTPSPQTPGTPSPYSGSQPDETLSSISSLDWDDETAKKYVESSRAKGSSSVMKIAAPNNNSLAYLWRNTVIEKPTSNRRDNLIIARLAGTTPPTLPSSLRATLETSGWAISYQTYPFSKKSASDVILILDELSNPILKHVDENQWESLKGIVGSGTPLLWVTKGAQYRITNPDNAMVHGLFRVARRENDLAKLTTLDVQSSTSLATNLAIDQLLQLIRYDASVETEYAERDGMLYIQRLVPDKPVNSFRRAEVDGLQPAVKDFYGNEAQVQLRAERLGTLQSLMWCETHVGEVPVEAGQIEVEVMAVGVNFKDVATTMGIVPENEFNIGFECAGTVKRLGPGVTKFKPGDRVCILKPGSYANRVRVSVERCHVIPDSMSFEDAATIPSVYLCSLYALYHLANLKEGQVSNQVFPSTSNEYYTADSMVVCSYPLGNRRCRNCLYPVGSI